MKSSFPIVTLAVALSLFGGTALRGQSPEDATSPPAGQEARDRAQAEAKQAYDRAKQELETARQQSQATQQHLERTQVRLAQAGPAASAHTTAFSDRLQSIIQRAPGSSAKPLVIRTAESDAAGQANLEEDLAVMSHLFDKSVDQALGGAGQSRKAMGINVLFAPGSSQLRSLYLEGYGAVFMLNVSSPLLPPPPKPEPQGEKPPEDSAWQEAKEELYGQHTAGRTISGPVEPYSEEKVSKLKDALLEALKNASNIRNLKADDSITVCVFGGASAAAPRPRAGVKPPPAPGAKPSHEDGPADNGAAMRNSMMTIRVKKSDVDAFAKGKVNIDEFRRKARSATYAADLGSGSGAFSYALGDGGVFGVPSVNPPPAPHPFGGGGGGGFGGSP